MIDKQLVLYAKEHPEYQKTVRFFRIIWAIFWTSVVFIAACYGAAALQLWDQWRKLPH